MDTTVFDSKMTELAEAIRSKNPNITGPLTIQGMIDGVKGIVVRDPEDSSSHDDGAYIDDTLYIANEDNTEYTEVENTQMMDAATITGSEDDGVYVHDNETQTWSN